MTTVQALKRDAALTNTNANHYRTLINKATSEGKLAELAIELQSVAIAHGRGLVEARFWLGAVVAKGEMSAAYKTGFIERLALNCGISTPVLRAAMKFHDLFRGDAVEMYNWCSSYIEKHGKILWGDITKLLSVNKVLVSKSRDVRKAEHRVAKYGEEWDTRALKRATDAIEGVEMIEPDPGASGDGFTTKVVTPSAYLKSVSDEKSSLREYIMHGTKLMSFSAARQELYNRYMADEGTHSVLVEVISSGATKFHMYLTLDPVIEESEDKP